MNIKRSIRIAIENRKKDGVPVVENVPIRLQVFFGGKRIDFNDLAGSSNCSPCLHFPNCRINIFFNAKPCFLLVDSYSTENRGMAICFCLVSFQKKEHSKCTSHNSNFNVTNLV